MPAWFLLLSVGLAVPEKTFDGLQECYTVLGYYWMKASSATTQRTHQRIQVDPLIFLFPSFFTARAMLALQALY